jgi:hypothetical protein
VVDPRNAKLLAERIPGAQLMIFPELGHLLFWQDPDGFVGVVSSFLLASGMRTAAGPPWQPMMTRCCVIGRPAVIWVIFAGRYTFDLSWICRWWGWSHRTRPPGL